MQLSYRVGQHPQGSEFDPYPWEEKQNHWLPEVSRRRKEKAENKGFQATIKLFSMILL